MLRKKRSYPELFWPVYSVSLRIQFKCGKMRTRITPNTDTFYAVNIFECCNSSNKRILIQKQNGHVNYSGFLYFDF